METGGGKETILFIHGLANYAPVWKHQMRELSGDFRSIAIDLPGNGFSSKGDYPYTPFFYAECVKRFVDAHGIERPVLAGHSMGGQIALMLSLRYPHLFDRLILIAPAGIENFTPTDRMIMQNLLQFGDYMYADESHLESTILDGFSETGAESKTLIHELKQLMKHTSANQWKKMCLDSIRGMIQEPMNRFLPHIQSKVLLLFGENDRLIPNRLLHPQDTTRSIAFQGAALIPNCEMHLIPHAGHFVQIEQHEQVNRYIRLWLS